VPEELWFDAEEGLMWVRRLREHLLSEPGAVKGCEAVLRELAEYEGVLVRAKAIGARWHFSVDF
jgi:hypothetical protein